MSSKISEIFNDYFQSPAMVEFVQVLLGYLTSDDNKDGDIFCFYGSGDRGKTTLYHSLLQHPQVSQFSVADIMKMIQNKNTPSGNLFVIDNILDINVLTPFLKMKYEGKFIIPNKQKYLAFVGKGIDQKFLDQYGHMATFIPIYAVFKENPEKPHHRKKVKKFGKFFEENKQEYFDWIDEGRKKYSKKISLKDFMPK